MSATMTLLTLAGNVALLLWGLHMVHSGLMRAFGATLRRWLAAAFNRRWRAFLAGAGVTAAMQSSNATGLMVGGFVGAGLVGVAPALAAMLGANIGTTIIVQFLSFNVAAIAPILVLAGVTAFKMGRTTRTRDLGRVSIGLGLILLALSATATVFERIEQADALRGLLAILVRDPLVNVFFGALLAWAAHSSVVIVLLVMSLAGALEPAAAATLVLGANLGSGIPQLVASANSPAARRLAVGNMFAKALGCAAALALLPWLLQVWPMLAQDAARQVAMFHMAFNVALALVLFGFVDHIARALEWLVPDAAPAPSREVPRYLEPRSEAAAPGVALAQAEREVLRIVDLVEAMLLALSEALSSGDRKKLAELAHLDDTIDRLYGSVKTYLTEVSRREGLAEIDDRRCAQLLAFTINLEHAGDILDRSLRELAAKKIKNNLNFSPEGYAEIAEMHRHVMEQLHVAVSVLMTSDPRMARALIDEKAVMRDLEEAATRNHLQRLREGRTLSIETSTLHLDIIRDLKRITAHLASVAYAVLEPTGELRRSRLSGS